jgi:hypothetical protein
MCGAMSWRLRTNLEPPPVLEWFPRRRYLVRRGIHGSVGWPEIRLLSRVGSGPVYRALLAVKARIQATIARILPEPEAVLLTGILLGVGAGIPERVKDAFSTSGTMHVVAISGSTISKLYRSGVGFRISMQCEHTPALDETSRATDTECAGVKIPGAQGKVHQIDKERGRSTIRV